MEKIEITNEQVEALFKGTNFGPPGETHEGRIALMVDCVFKGFAGYASGSTIEGICDEAGLKDDWNKPTRAGARWAYHQAFPLPNVKEHATLSAGASVDHGVEVETTVEHVNRAADRGCCVSACCASSIQWDYCR